MKTSRKPARKPACSPARRRNPDDIEDRLVQCFSCGQLMPEFETAPVDEGDSVVCTRCASSTTVRCGRETCDSGRWSTGRVHPVYVGYNTARPQEEMVIVEEWCPPCVAMHAQVCERPGCGQYATPAAMLPVVQSEERLRSWCPECVDAFGTWCPQCGGTYWSDTGFERVYSSDAALDETLRLVDRWCRRCVSLDARWCAECGRFRGGGHVHGIRSTEGPPRRSGDPEVVAPYHEAQRRGIKFKPCVSDWTRKQPKPLYFGVELEVLVPSGRDREPYAQQVLDSIGPKFGDFLYDIQHDGSLGWFGGAGFEIITQPCGLDTHREYWSKADFTNLTNDRNGIKAGLHVHISRSAFKKVTEQAQGKQRHPVIGRMAQFLYDWGNKRFVETIARRTFNEFARQLADTQISQAAHGGPVAFSGHEARYEALNLSGDKTVEFRLPKSTTEPTTIMATLEFVFLLLRFCEQVSNMDLDHGVFKKFIVEDRWAKDSRFLRAYLVDRGLATAQEMKLPRLKPEGLRTNPSRRPRLRDDAPGPYARRALAEYRRTGE